MTSFLVIAMTSLGLAGLYFLLSSGLSLIFGMMDVLNVSHGAFFGVGGYAAWVVMDRLDVVTSLVARFAVAAVVATIVGFGLGVLAEKVLIVRNYGDHLAQILVTLGLAFLLEGLLGGLFSYAPQSLAQPAWFTDVTVVAGARIPNSRLLIIVAAVLVLVGLLWFLRSTRYGLIIRAGVENRRMVRALGIDVGRSFTLVFGLGAALACLGGALGAVYFTGIDPALGPNQLIFAFIVVIIGGLGSIEGTAIAAVLVAFTQQLVNYYVDTGLGDIAVAVLLAAVLLVRPQGLMGKAGATRGMAPETSARSATNGTPRIGRQPGGKVLFGCAAVALLAVFPFVDLVVPVLLPSRLSSPASLLVVAVGLVFAGVAISYDLLFGYTGLLSAGHALVFALGAYLTSILMLRGVDYGLAVVVAASAATVVNAALGAIALRVRAVAFTMVTLAFGEAFFFLLLIDPWRIFGGDEGLPLAFDQVPSLLAGVRDTRWVYWLSLAFAVVSFLVSVLVTQSRCGQVWQAIRENEDRVEMLGLVPYGYKLIAFTVGGALSAVGGCLYVVVVRGANPASAAVQFSLALIVMVVLGGRGRLWGAAVGGLIYGVLTLRLPELASSGALEWLPVWAARTLPEPLFALGALFVLVMLFAPGGVAGLVDRLLAHGSTTATRQETTR